MIYLPTVESVIMLKFIQIVQSKFYRSRRADAVLFSIEKLLLSASAERKTISKENYCERDKIDQ